MSGPILVLSTGDEALEGGVDAEAVQGVEESVEAICRALGRAGLPIERRSVREPRDVLAALDSARPAVVFHLVESIGGDAEMEAAVAGLFELLGVAFTGSPARALALSQNKPLAKAALQGLGLPTPRWRILRPDDEPDFSGLTFPCIVKPGSTHASHGIGSDSVVQGAEAALEKARTLWRQYGPDVLVEDYIDGREINVAILGEGASARCLPLSEIDFRLRPGLPRIVTYAAKWIEGAEDWGASEVLCPAPLPPDVARAIESISLAAYRGFGCRDYARVDLRLDGRGQPWILEINPNPDLAPTAGLARSAGRILRSYDELILGILESARKRGRPAPRPVA